MSIARKVSFGSSLASSECRQHVIPAGTKTAFQSSAVLQHADAQVDHLNLAESVRSVQGFHLCKCWPFKYCSIVTSSIHDNLLPQSSATQKNGQQLCLIILQNPPATCPSCCKHSYCNEFWWTPHALFAYKLFDERSPVWNRTAPCFDHRHCHRLFDECRTECRVVDSSVSMNWHAVNASERYRFHFVAAISKTK